MYTYSYTSNKMKRKIKKELLEWVILISVFGIIYLGGWHTEVIGKAQQLVLSTGLIKPGIAEENIRASYDFWLEDFEGNRVAFADFKGEVVFINFWATWCPPCIAEMPDIHNLYQVQKDQVAFVMISLDKDPQKAKNYITKKEFEFPVYFLQSGLPPSYNTRSIPTTYVIDKEGTIKVENHGMAKYNTDDFNQLLNDLAKPQ